MPKIIIEPRYDLLKISTKTTDPIINTGNAFIALIVMLILLFTLQSPVCCDGVITSELTLPPALEQTQRQERIAYTADHPDDTMIMTVSAVAANIDQFDTETTTTEIGEMKTDVAATLADVNRTGFVKLSYSGEFLAENSVNWECVEDKSNRLTWEVKKDDGGVRDRDHSYSWLREIGGVKDGIGDGGRCKGGVSCDTSSYARAMNEQNLCGYSDWRLPTRAELETLVEFNSNPTQATINKTYFPQAIPSWYWTASEHPHRKDYAWYVLFRNGVALNDLKERPKHIRLVRGEIRQ